MTDIPDETQADDGSERSKDDSNRDYPLEFDLPEHSLFDEEDYQKLCQVVSRQICSDILHALQKNERLSANEISDVVDKEPNDIYSYLDPLTQTALIRKRREMRSGTNKPYSYYTLTSLGEVILKEGLADGVQKLAAQEHEIEDRYST